MNHQMTLLIEYDNGVMIFKCPICGRHIVIQVQPYKSIVLIEGDESVTHSGGTGGVQMGPVEIVPEDENLRPFEDFMNKLGGEL